MMIEIFSTAGHDADRVRHWRCCVRSTHHLISGRAPPPLDVRQAAMSLDVSGLWLELPVSSTLPRTTRVHPCHYTRKAPRAGRPNDGPAGSQRSLSLGIDWPPRDKLAWSRTPPTHQRISTEDANSTGATHLHKRHSSGAGGQVAPAWEKIQKGKKRGWIQHSPFLPGSYRD